MERTWITLKTKVAGVDGEVRRPGDQILRPLLVPEPRANLNLMSQRRGTQLGAYPEITMPFTWPASQKEERFSVAEFIESLHPVTTLRGPPLSLSLPLPPSPIDSAQRRLAGVERPSVSAILTSLMGPFSPSFTPDDCISRAPAPCPIRRASMGGGMGGPYPGEGRTPRDQH